jgi:hypothetical protein
MAVEVQNERPLSFPVDVRISVLNKNPKTFYGQFDGEVHEFPPGEATIIDTETAFALFAVDTRTAPGYPIKIRRDKNAGKIGPGNSWYHECRVKYGANTAEGEVWFDNFEFKMVKTTRRQTREEFERLK